MKELDFYSEQTEDERNVLKAKLIERVRDLRLEAVLSALFILIAPYIAFRVGEEPLIAIMTYEEALTYFGICFLIYLIASFFIKSHRRIQALQTTRKRIFTSRIANVFDSMLGKSTELHFYHNDIKYIDIPTDLNIFKRNDHVLVEVSELGKQVLRIQRLDEDDFEHLKEPDKVTFYTKTPYWSTLIGTIKNRL